MNINRIRLIVALKIFFLLIGAICASSAFAQNQKKTKWQGLTGKDNEFIFLIPENFQSFQSKDYYSGRSAPGIYIKNHLTVSRYINGVLLMMDLYEGGAKEMQHEIVEGRELVLIKETAVNGFQNKTFVKKTADYIWEQQHFLIKNRLYVLHGVYRGEKSEIAQNFFKSVRLINEKQVVAPNFPKEAKKETLTSPLPEITEEIGDLEPLQGKPDKEAVIVFIPIPPFNREFGRSNAGDVKLNILLSANGKVAKIETKSSPNQTLAKGVADSAQSLVFLPAEKDGKPVTVWKEQRYSFEMSTRIN